MISGGIGHVAAFGRRRLFAGLLVALAALALGSGSASAASQSNHHNNDLIKAFHRRTSDQTMIADRLAEAATYDANVNAVIDQLRAQGYDTARLDQGLAQFRSQISAVRGEWAKAATLLQSHAGFNDQGLVTDKGLAARTVGDALNEQELMKRMGSSVYDKMHEAFRDFASQQGAQLTEPTRPENNSLFS